MSATGSAAELAEQQKSALLGLFLSVREETDRLLQLLSPEDQCIQSMPDASPAKWHAAHTSWFFEEFVLAKWARDYQRYNPAFNFLFNSYYEGAGPRLSRGKRGLITRPSSEEIANYRKHITSAVSDIICTQPHNVEMRDVLAIGLNHEQQHQELLLTDILHAFAQNPLCPPVDAAWRDAAAVTAGVTPSVIPSGVYEIGADGSSFSFDNECPVHRVYLDSFVLDPVLVTNGDWLAFMADGGYERADLWLSDGWAQVRANIWSAPEYWSRDEAGWSIMSLAGRKLVDPARAVCHISYFEADAYARWVGKRLPSEAEWEIGARLHAPEDAFGVRWQWTQSAYAPYPRFKPLSGTLGEYNGKFMSNQMVLRGSSVVTPVGHSRLTYRNFFYPHQRWQFTGLRLASDI